MSSKLTLPIVVFLATCTTLCADTTRKTTLRDGFVLTGVDGKVTRSENKWFLELDSDRLALRRLALRRLGRPRNESDRIDLGAPGADPGTTASSPYSPWTAPTT